MAKRERFLFMDWMCSAQDTMGKTVLALSDAAQMWGVQHLKGCEVYSLFVFFLSISLRQLSY